MKRGINDEFNLQEKPVLILVMAREQDRFFFMRSVCYLMIPSETFEHPVVLSAGKSG